MKKVVQHGEISEENVAKRREKKKFYFYECSITGEKYKTTREAPNPDELLSVKAFYEMNPEEDDRPLAVKKTQAFVELETEESEDESEEEASSDV